MHLNNFSDFGFSVDDKAYLHNSSINPCPANVANMVSS